MQGHLVDIRVLSVSRKGVEIVTCIIKLLQTMTSVWQG